MLRRGQPDSWESCIVLQSKLTHSLVAKFPQHSVIACSTHILCCRERTLRMRPRTGVGEPLMPDVVVPKVHQNNHNYVSSADLHSDSLRKNLAWWVVTRRTSKTVKVGWLALAQVLALAQDNMVINWFQFAGTGMLSFHGWVYQVKEHHTVDGHSLRVILNNSPICSKYPSAILLGPW